MIRQLVARLGRVRPRVQVVDQRGQHVEEALLGQRLLAVVGEVGVEAAEGEAHRAHDVARQRLDLDRIDDFVGTERPDEILVASREHDIDVITDVQYDTELLSGINYMKVELDYVVG